MPIALEQFLIKLFLALGNVLVSKGLLVAEDMIATEAKIKKAKEYQKTVNNPEASREERRKAEDDFLS